MLTDRAGLFRFCVLGFSVVLVAMLAGCGSQETGADASVRATTSAPDASEPPAAPQQSPERPSARISQEQPRQKAADSVQAAPGLILAAGSKKMPSAPAAPLSSPTLLPTASIDRPADVASRETDRARTVSATATDSAPAVAEPITPTTPQEVAEQHAESLLMSITRLRVASLPETNDPERLKQARRERNLEIVDMATQAIALTHRDPKLERLFDAAVQYLMNAQMELALQGDPDDINALYEHAEALYRRDPASRAAAEAAFVVARFVYANAQRFADKEPRWLTEYARQARLYAARFPQQKARAATLLWKAGRSCELHGLAEEAVACYETLQETFPDTPQARQATALIRRLTLEGESLNLAGPTLDGHFFSMDELRGRPVMVVFWTTTARQFLEHLPRLLGVCSQYKPQGLAVVSVSLDTDPKAVQAFLQQYRIDWPVIFYTEPQHSGWNNPIALYYGVLDVPQVWLVSRAGKVVATRIDWYRLDELVGRLVGR
ncbi:MAG: redoxin domain-containing protein [Planctomycetes bacterium]|nr:redoxin domain-containing protein [Planctomycetota bacterium]